MLCSAKVCYEDTAKPYRKQYPKTSTGVKEWLRLRRDINGKLLQQLHKQHGCYETCIGFQQ
jgi:hypothetical protein